MQLSNQSRYNKDRGIFVGWFQVHPQFVGYDTDRLVSLSTGIVADTSVNCDNAVELGLKAASEMAGKKFTEIKLCRNDKIPCALKHMFGHFICKFSFSGCKVMTKLEAWRLFWTPSWFLERAPGGFLRTFSMLFYTYS
ncbi:hypothetical protein GQR58_019848 [Nymphon striatum]|nr:hypothetical protein GQR58_019848 [Nymphon striatum]